MTTVSQIPAVSAGRFCQMTAVSNCISSLLRLQDTLEPEGQRAQQVAETEIDDGNHREGLDWLEGIVADAGRYSREFADREQRKNRACLEVTERDIGQWWDNNSE